MRRFLLFLSLAALLAPGCSKQESATTSRNPDDEQERSVEWSFDQLPVDKAPNGFRVEAGEWRVKKDPEQLMNVLAQTGKSGEKVFNLILAGDVTAKDVDVSAELYPMSGEIDQGGGLVWRAQDGRNYYVCRWNPLESNYRVYKVIDGVRTELASALAPDDQDWHTLRAVMNGKKIVCWLDDQKLLEVEDDSIPDGGRVGLWTKADADTLFREFRAAWQ